MTVLAETPEYVAALEKGWIAATVYLHDQTPEKLAAYWEAFHEFEDLVRGTES